MSLADNVVHFARLLRAAGIPIGTDRIMLALQALEVAGIESRTDFYAALFTCLISRAEHRVLFDRAFAAFWPALEMRGQLPQSAPPLRGKRGGASRPAERRVVEALFPRPDSREASTQAPVERRAELSWSDRERLRKADFETMSTQEWSQARRLVAALRTALPELPSRRFEPSGRGERIDLHKILREAASHGGELVSFPRRRRRMRPVPLVVIVDISGSMSRYAQMYLHFTHALSQAAEHANSRLHVFTFGTRLTHITRSLRGRDPDVALAGVANAVDDWSGGTRIAACLKELNVKWARRVLSSRSTVLLVTDGLERADLHLLASQMERLAKSCRRLIWLNPLLRYSGFEPKARGVRTMLPFVDRHMPVHNVESLEQLAAVLATCFRSRSPEPDSPPFVMPRALAWT